MSLLTEKKRLDEATALSALKTQILNASAQLQGAKTNLANLKAKLAADGDFSEADEAEVQAVIDLFVTEKAKL